MITETQIIEAAKETGIAGLTFMYQEQRLRMMDYAMPELQRFAKHFYRQGLLDAAEKCVSKNWNYANEAQSEAIRQMAEEIK